MEIPRLDLVAIRKGFAAKLLSAPAKAFDLTCQRCTLRDCRFASAPELLFKLFTVFLIWPESRSPYVCTSTFFDTDPAAGP
ncbi:hypothetical protein D3C77_662060 [compost metagenome]